MKIICDSCKTKYSIADEKVKGKVFKIRCKKCQNVIVVKGTDEGAAAADGPADAGSGVNAHAAAAPAAVGAVWHLVIDREQVGPMTADEVKGRLSRGEVDADTYGWRDGFSDWKRLAHIDEFAAAASGGNGAAPSAGMINASTEVGSRDGAGDLFAAGGGDEPAGASDDAGDLFASPPAATAPAAFASSGDAGAKDLFARDDGFSSPTRSENGGASARMSGGGGGATVDSRLTGQRNENSVLFSLNNLQALAMGGGGAAKRDSGGGGGSAASGPTPGMAMGAASGGDGSGLIDLRAVAATVASDRASSYSSGGPDEILPITAGPAFSPTMAASVLMPTSSSDTPKWLWPAVAGGGVLVIALAAVAIVAVTRTPPPVPVAPVAPVAAPAAGTPAAGTPAAAGAAGTPAGAAGTPAAGTPAAGTPAAGAAGTPAAAGAPAAAGTPEAGSGEPKAAPVKTVASKGKGRPTGGGGGKATKAAPSKAAPSEPAKPDPTKGKRKRDNLDDLLDDATKGSSRGGGGSGTRAAAAAPRPAPAAAPAPSASSSDDNLPEQLTQGQVKAGVGRVRGRIQTCGSSNNASGTATVNFTISRSGRVTGASVSGSMAGSAAGNCVASAVRTASFPKFKGEPMAITYPFMLR